LAVEVSLEDMDNNRRKGTNLLINGESLKLKTAIQIPTKLIRIIFPIF